MSEDDENKVFQAFLWIGSSRQNHRDEDLVDWGPGECVKGLGDSDPLVQDIMLHQVGPKQFLNDSWKKVRWV